jgi:hypothetical protein
MQFLYLQFNHVEKIMLPFFAKFVRLFLAILLQTRTVNKLENVPNFFFQARKIFENHSKQ